jgi:hypothetical protein
MGSFSKLWKDLDIFKPLKKTGFIISGIILVIFSFISFYTPLFPDEIKNISHYKILENFNLEIRYFLILLNIAIIIFIYVIIFINHNLLKFYENKDADIYSIVNINEKSKGKSDLHCVFYSNLGAYYYIGQIINNKEQIYVKGWCKITNNSDSKIYISSVKIKENYNLSFSVSQTGGENYILPNEVVDTSFFGNVDSSLFKIKQDIITDVIITDNFSNDYILKNIRFRYNPKK